MFTIQADQTKKHIVITTFACAVMSIVFFAHSTYAAGLLPDCPKGQYSVDAFIALIFNVIKFLWGLTGSAALVMLVVGGFYMLLAGGDPQGAKSGVPTIRNAIIGILLVLGSWIIINLLVSVFTGTPINSATVFGAAWWQAGDPCYP